jgi:hypothetical protein
MSFFLARSWRAFVLTKGDRHGANKNEIATFVFSITAKDFSHSVLFADEVNCDRGGYKNNLIVVDTVISPAKQMRSTTRYPEWHERSGVAPPAGRTRPSRQANERACTSAAPNTARCG